MAEIKFGKKVTLAQAAKLITSNPKLRFMLRGEPGIGKSSLLKAIGEQTGYEVAYIDVPNMDLGDIAMPVIDHDTRTTKYYPNARFKMHEGKPVVVMLDEFTKGADPVKNMLHPLLEKVNPRLGDVSPHENSIFFLTGNLGSDGVGDHLKAHSLNRLVTVEVAKPTADEWIEWGMNNDIAPEVLAFVKQYPHAMASYTDAGQADNPYIYNPKTPQVAFFSPRSAETASDIIKTRGVNDADAVIAALSGAIGEATARDLYAYVQYVDELPTRNEIIFNPQSARIPTSPGACAVIVFGSVMTVDKDSLAPVMTYIERLEPEWQAVFAINLAKNKSKQALAFGNKKFAEWLAANQDLL
jgi:hypothetical protein